jgi:hypothetical protein
MFTVIETSNTGGAVAQQFFPSLNAKATPRGEGSPRGSMALEACRAARDRSCDNANRLGRNTFSSVIDRRRLSIVDRSL